MENRSGQISVEFMLLIALVLLIFIPIFILISRAGLETTDQVSGERIGALARTILDEARETYYLGEGSRQRITLDVPDVINSIMVVSTVNTHELAINFTQASTTSLVSAVSEVPIRIRSVQSASCDPEPTCSISCSCERLDADGIRSGSRDIELLTTRDADGLVVEIGYR